MPSSNIKNEINIYKKAGLHEKLHNTILDSLVLDSNEVILIKIRLFPQKTPTDRFFRDLHNFLVITSKRLLVLRFSLQARETKIKTAINHNDITNINVLMKHDINSPMPKVSLTKIPVLTIKTPNKEFEVPLRNFFYAESKVNHIISAINTRNNKIQINLNFDRGGFDSVMDRIFFKGIPTSKPEGIKQKRKLIVYAAIVVCLGIIAHCHSAKQLAELKEQNKITEQGH